MMIEPTTTIAGIVALIAFQQMRINHDKLKLDLYNKRFDIYTDALKFYQELIRQDVSEETHLKFINSKEAAFFLFSSDPQIYKILQEMHERSSKVTGLRDIREKIHDPTIVLGFEEDAQQTVIWTMKHISILQARLKAFLAF